jgi:hypothetical protein
MIKWLHFLLIFFLLFPDFIIRLDRMYGPLTLHSSVKDMVKYTQYGLDYLSKEKDQER